MANLDNNDLIKGDKMSPDLEFLLGGLFMWGAIPFSIGAAIGIWASGTKFPMALLIGMILVPVFFFGGGAMVLDGGAKRDHRDIAESRSSTDYQPFNKPLRYDTNDRHSINR